MLRLCNCKHWLKFQQSWANHCFRIDGLEHLDTISLIDVYELMIHAAIQQRSPLISMVKLTFCDNHEKMYLKIFKMQTTRSKQQTFFTLCPGNLY